MGRQWDTICEGYLTELKDGVLTLTFNRPEARNPFIKGMSVALTGLLKEANETPDIRCLLVTGAGNHLTAGGDIVGFARALEQPIDKLQGEFRGRLLQAADLVRALVGFERPILVRHRGAVAGAGMMFPLAADLVIADETAQFVFAYNRIGLVPDGGVSWLLPRVVGGRAARRLMLTAASVGAEEARALGLIDRVVPANELDETVVEAAARFANAPQQAVRRTKSMLWHSLETALEDQLAAETEGIVACVGDADFREGVTAFLEKRSARFPSVS